MAGCFVTPQGDTVAGSNVAELVQQAVSSVPAAEAAELWVLGFDTLPALGLPLNGLLQHLSRTLAGSKRGPLRVRTSCVRAYSDLPHVKFPFVPTTNVSTDAPYW